MYCLFSVLCTPPSQCTCYDNYHSNHKGQDKQSDQWRVKITGVCTVQDKHMLCDKHVLCKLWIELAGESVHLPF